MKVVKGREKATHELTDLTVHEVSLVSRAANKRKFIVVKSGDGMRGKMIKSEMAPPAPAEASTVPTDPGPKHEALVAEIGKIDTSTEAGRETLRVKALELAATLAGPPPSPSSPGSTPQVADLAVTKSTPAVAPPETTPTLSQKQLSHIASALEQLAVVIKQREGTPVATSNAATDADAGTSTTTKVDPWAQFN